tara:strand:- start:886 stop:2271 length:1386 start_codon:yes stop_codon:yes gene_type:complete
MGLNLYNTATRKVEELKPQTENAVKMYSCGPTVYNDPHIGNFRAFIFVDVLKRFLTFTGYTVKHVMNVTDVDDKIIQRCRDEGKSREELTEKYCEAFMDGCRNLGIEPPDVVPKAADHIQEMIELIQSLVDKEHAYVTDNGSVFFKIESYPDYGKLSKIDMAELTQTERVESDEYDKLSVNDFALWKGRKEEDCKIFWESPWGEGRPGWHIECSAMSMKYLGKEFDIHTGGVDLIFPHHENEAAQSVCCTGTPFVNHWVHSEHLIVDGAKMSKSLDNFYTLDDLVEKRFSLSTIRYFLLTTHYRQKINLTDKKLTASTSSVERLRDFRQRMESIGSDNMEFDNNEVIEKFISVMNDDLNIAEGMGVIFEWIREINKKADENQLTPKGASIALAALKKFDSILGVIFDEKVILSKEDQSLIQERKDARENKNWGRADEIRDYFGKKGIQLKDTPFGVVLKIN